LKSGRFALASPIWGVITSITNILIDDFRYVLSIDMELRHLRYFCIAAEEMHIGRAAERLAIAQPPLTQQIKMLEAEMGVHLFRRQGRGVVLTEAGRIFHDKARAILAQVDRAVELAREAETGHAGRLRIGFTESASFSAALTGILKSFRDRWPRVALVLEERHTETLFSSLQQGSLDLAFMRPPFSSVPEIAIQELTSEAMMLAVPVAHRLAGRQSVTLSKLAGEDFVAYPRHRGAGLSDAVLAECRRVGFAPRIAQEAPQVSSMINLVSAGMGVAIVPESLRHTRPDTVRFLRVTDCNVRAMLSLGYRNDDPSRTIRNFLKLATVHAAVGTR
jgi:DNA-binding transcriptional LysR family regulator